MKDRLKDHLEGWQFCENCGIKLYQKINGCSGMIGSILHLSGGLCNYWDGSKKMLDNTSSKPVSMLNLQTLSSYFIIMSS